MYISCFIYPKLLFPGPGDIHSGYLKLILGLIWRLILKYQFVLFSTDVIEEVVEDPVQTVETPTNNALPTVVETVHETKSETPEVQTPTPSISESKQLQPALASSVRTDSPQLLPGTVRRGSAQISPGTTRRGSSQLSSSKAAANISVKKVLLYYLQCCLPKMDIKNFTTNWSDGMALAGLVEHLRPKVIPGFETLSPTNALENTQTAMDTAEKEYKIPQVIKAVHLVEQPDELSLMTYLSYFCNSGSIGETSLLKWINAKLHPHYVVTNFAVDWNNGKALGGLINACSPGLFPDHASLDPENQVENVTRSLNTASEKLGIDHPFSPKEMADSAVNKLYMMGYLTQYRFLETPSESLQVIEPVATLAEEALVESAVSLGKVEELPPDPTKVEMVAEPDLDSGAALDMYFDTAGAGGGNLEASCVGDKAGEVDVVVTKKEGDKYSVSFTPPEPDMYTLTVKWGGDNVQGSPFKLNLKQPLPDKVVLLEPPSARIESGDPLNIVLSTKEAGRGTLTASCTGKDSGDVPCSVIPKGEDKYDVSFVPPQLDIYQLNVKWSDEHVPGSPYKINLLPTNAEKVEIAAKPESGLESGVPLDMEFDTSGAGGGSLEASCIGDKAGKVDVTVKQKEEDKYSVSFTPPEPDMYRLTIKWGGKHVKGSPFKFNLQDPIADNVELVEAPSSSIRSGTPLNMVFSTEEAGAGALTAACNGEISGEIPCSVTSKGFDKYDVKFLPPQPDVYHVDVKWCGEHVPGSPFRLNLFPPVASNVKVVAEPEMALEAGVPSDILSFDTSTAGGGELDTFCVGNKVGKVPVEVTPIDDDRFNISFTPPEPDVYVVSVKWGGEHVKGSPFHINMLQPVAKRVKLISLPETSVKPGEPLSVGLDTSKAGEGVMEAACSGKDSGEVACSIEPNKDDSNKLTVSFTPPQPDIYHLKVMWSGEHVVGSPFKINLIPPVAEKVELVTEPPPVHQEPGNLVDLDFDTSRAGDGELQATCVGAKCGEVPVEVQTAGDDKYKIHFTPPEPDLYEVSVKWAGEHVRGSPFQINTLTPSPVSEQVEMIEANQVEGGLDLDDFYDEDEDKSYKGETEPPLVYYIGQVFQLGVDHEEGEEGDRQLTVECNGKQTGRTNFDVFRNVNDTYAIQFEPITPDRYTLAALMDGEHIPGSPFVIDFLIPVDPSKCRVSGLPTRQPQVNSTLRLTVDCSEAGIAELAARVDSPPGEVSELKAIQKDQGHYSIMYTPTTVGIHKLYIEWDEEPLICSPIIFDVSKEKAEVFPHGSSINLDIDAEGTKAKYVSAHAIYEPTNEKFKVAVKKVEKKDQVKLTFKPKLPGIYRVHVFNKDEEIPDSPIKVKYAKPFNPNAVSVVALGSVPYFVWEPIELAVDCKDAGFGELLVKSSEPGTYGQKICKTTDNDDGTFSVIYVPATPGQHRFDITWSDKNIKGSPLSLQVFAGGADCVKLVKAPGQNLKPGTDICHVYDCTEAGKGTMEASCVGKATGEQPCTVEQNESNEKWMDVCFTPSQEDVYHVHVKWSGDAVSGSPFKVNLLPPVAENVEMISHPDSLEAGAPVDLDFDTSEAGGGLLDTSCVGKQAGNVPITVKPLGEDKYRISFIPPQPDSYELTIKWGGEQVKGSPFKIDLLQSVAKNVKLLSLPSTSVKSGEPLAMVFDTSKAGKGVLEATCNGKKTDEVPCSVIANNDDNHRFAVSFTPPQPDIYYFKVTWSGEHVPGSPFKISLLPPVAENVKVVEEPQAALEAGLSFDTSTAGGGKLDAVCVGRKVGNVAVEVLPGGDDKYNIVFDPPEPDIFDVSVKWGGEHVKGSPFTIDMLKPVAHRVKLISLPSNTVESNEPLSVGFDTIKAGEGIMEATCNGEKSGAIACSIDKDDRSKVKVSFIPPQPDVYLMKVTWSGEDVPGSPFKINFLPPIAENVEVVAEPETALEAGVSGDILNVDTSGAGGGKLDAVCVGKNVGNVPIEVTPTGDDKYTIVFDPPEPDIYEVSIKWGGEHVRGSPFIIDKLKPVASRVKLISLPSTSLDSGDALAVGFDTSKAGKGVLEAVCNGEQVGDVACSIDTDKNDNSKVKVSFIPPQSDVYYLTVTWSGEHISGSPFKVNLLPSNATNVAVVAEPEASLEAGVPTDLLSFDTSAAGGGKLEAVCVGSKAGEVPVEVTPAGDDKYNISFTPPEPDMYEVSVMWGGEHVKGSPFMIDMLKPKASKVILISPPSGEVQVGSAVSLGYDTTNAGKGVMEATCTGDITENVQCTIEHDKDNNNKITVSFVAPQPDVYTLSVTWSGDHVPGSPYKISLLPPIADKVDTKEQAVLEAEVPTDVLNFDAPGDELETICIGSKVGEVPVKVTPAGDDKYTIVFDPPEPDMYEVTVKFEGKHVKGSPFKINMLRPDADKVKLVLPPTSNVASGNPVTMAFDTTDAGNGKMEADCNGEECGAIKCSVYKDEEKENQVNVMFVPYQHDIYHISVKWSGKHVPRSPFKINMLPPIAGKVKLITKPPSELEEGNPVDVELDTSKAGGGHLSATCVGKSVDEMPVNIERQRPGVHKVSFTPVDPDSYELSIKWSGKHISGSPFNIRLFALNDDDSLVHKLEFEPNVDQEEDESTQAAPVESSTRVLPPNLFDAEGEPREFIYGHPVELYIAAIDVKHKNVTAHAIHQETNEQIPVTVKKFNRDHNKLIFKPQVPGIYSVHVIVNQEEISTSPYNIRYQEPFDATAVKLKLLDSEPYTVGEHVRLMVDCIEAGKANLSVRATGPAFGHKPICKVTDNKDGTHFVSYQLNSVGKYKIEISESGKQVAGSPVKVKVVQTVPERVTLLTPLPSAIKPGEATNLNFTTSRAGDGKLSASCMGEQCGKVHCDVTNHKDTATISFIPPQTDIYHVGVKWAGTHVPGSPFKIQ